MPGDSHPQGKPGLLKHPLIVPTVRCTPVNLHTLTSALLHRIKFACRHTCRLAHTCRHALPIATPASIKIPQHRHRACQNIHVIVKSPLNNPTPQRNTNARIHLRRNRIPNLPSAKTFTSTSKRFRRRISFSTSVSTGRRSSSIAHPANLTISGSSPSLLPVVRSTSLTLPPAMLPSSMPLPRSRSSVVRDTNAR